MTWHSLYIRAENAREIAAALLERLAALGYIPYDPFPGGSGTPPGPKKFLRAFAAPPTEGWVRILGEVAVETLSGLSAGRTVLHAWLVEGESRIDAYRNGTPDSGGLAAHLKPGKTPDDLERALQGAAPTPTGQGRPASGPLSGELEQLARQRGVNAEQANRMIERLTGRLFGKLDRQSGGEASALQDQARAMIGGAHGAKPDWNGPAGRRLLALAQVLALPPNWREPDFDAVREAYQVARRLQKNPGARLLPDEQDALRAVPDAMHYQPIYVGR